MNVTGRDEVERKKRPPWANVVLALVPALAFIALLGYGLGRSGDQVTLGERAPEFELPSVQGDDRVSSADLEGRPVVVNFWASWCIPCREEAPLLERTWQEYRDDGVVFLGINIKDAESDAQAFIEEFGITYPNVRDADQTVSRTFGVVGLPETFFIDDNWTFIGTAHGGEESQEQGTVVLGAITEEELVDNVEVLLRRSASRDEGDG